MVGSWCWCIRVVGCRVQFIYEGLCELSVGTSKSLGSFALLFCVYICGGWGVSVVKLVELLPVVGCEWLVVVVSDSAVTNPCTCVGVFWFCGLVVCRGVVRMSSVIVGVGVEAG